MSLNNAANMPFLTHAATAFGRMGTLAKVIPVKYWRMAAMAIALLWICNTLVVLFWAVIPNPKMPVPHVVPSLPKTAVAASSGPVVDIAQLQKLNILGNFDPDAAEKASAPPVAVEGDPVPKTKLNLELQGVIAGSDSESSWAIIGKADAQKLYKIGDTVENARGVKISNIYPKKVILDNNGTLEELWLYGVDGEDVGVAYVAPKPKKRGRSEPKKKANTAVIDKSEVMSVKSIGDVVRFMVATEDGRMIGYKVRPGRKRKLFDQVGLKTDDIVISVNGIEVNEPQKVREVYQALKDATEADLEVMRDGNSHSIHISMNPEG